MPCQRAVAILFWHAGGMRWEGRPERPQGKLDAMTRVQTCPVCGNAISPTLLQYFPPKGGYKQYQCPHCNTWLVISGQSRLSIGIFAALVGFPMLLGIVHLRSTVPKGALVLLLATFFVAWLVAMALFARYTATWIAEPPTPL